MNYLHIPQSLIYLTRGGNVNIEIGSLRSADINGYIWAATAYTYKLHAYFLGFNDANVYPSNSSDGRWLGFMVRSHLGGLGVAKLKSLLILQENLDRKAIPATTVTRRVDTRAIKIKIVRIEFR